VVAAAAAADTLPCPPDACCVVLYKGGKGAQCDPVPIWDFTEWRHPGGSFVNLASNQLCGSVKYNWKSKTFAHSRVNPEAGTNLKGGAVKVGTYTDPSCPTSSPSANPTSYPTKSEKRRANKAIYDRSGPIAPGTYYGEAEKKIGCVWDWFCTTKVNVETTAIAHADSTLSIKVKARGNLPVDLDCPNEAYTLGTNGAITLLNYPWTDASTGDCIEKALPPGINLKTLMYQNATIDMSVSAPLGINMDISAAIQPAADTNKESTQRSLRRGFVV